MLDPLSQQDAGGVADLHYLLSAMLSNSTSELDLVVAAEMVLAGQSRFRSAVG